MKQLAARPDSGPIVMVNLLKFKPDGGAESYAKYGREATKLVRKVGGRVLYSGRYLMPVIGQGDWDEVLLVEYPSIKDFFNMIAMEEYRAVVHYRTEALIDSRLWATKPAE
jgi:uncharacterized protein (DUF1330 family)